MINKKISTILLTSMNFISLEAMLEVSVKSQIETEESSQVPFIRAILQGEFDTASAIMASSGDVTAVVNEQDAFGNTSLILTAKLLAKYYATTYGSKVPNMRPKFYAKYDEYLGPSLEFQDPWIDCCEGMRKDEKLHTMEIFMKALINRGSSPIALNRRGKNFLNYLVKKKAFAILDPFLVYLNDETRFHFIRSIFTAWAVDILGEPCSRILGDKNIKILALRAIAVDLFYFCGYLIDCGNDIDKETRQLLLDYKAAKSHQNNGGKKFLNFVGYKVIAPSVESTNKEAPALNANASE